MLISKPLLLVIFLSFFFSANAQKPEIKFKHLSGKDGFSNGFIRNIVQDHQGFLWFATAVGLNKYDGYSVDVYKTDPKDNTSLFCNDVWELYEDSRKRLWIGTRLGLTYYVRETNSFKKEPALQGFEINYIFEDKRNNLWVVALGKLYKYDLKTDTFLPEILDGLYSKITTLYEDKNNNLYIGSADGVHLWDMEKSRATFLFKFPFVTSFYEDTNSDLWIASKTQGLMIYNPITRQQRRYTWEKGNQEITDNIFLKIQGDSDYIYLGTESSGLVLYDKKLKQFYTYKHNPSNAESISFNSIYSILIDRNKNVWVGTFSGINLISQNKFDLIRHQPGNANSISHNIVLCFSEDENGNLWIGTDGGGLNYYNRKDNSFLHFRHNFHNTSTLGSDNITYIEPDGDGNLWVGTWSGGLNFFDKKKKTFLRYLPDPKNAEGSILSRNISCLYKDRHQNIWIGTSSGIDYLDHSTKAITHYSTPENGLLQYISTIYQDKDDNIWVGTFKGLFLLDKETKKTTTFLHKEDNNRTISNDLIFSITEASKGNFWVGTLGGLNLFNKKDQFTLLTEKDGMPNNAILNIEEDDSENLWIATSAGLGRYNLKDKKFKNYNISDGLQDNDFKQNAHIRLKSKEFAYGGPNGLNIFSFQKLRENKDSPPIVLTNFSIFNQSVKIAAADSILKHHISVTDEVTLSHRHSVFSFDFVALNFVSPEKNQYAYKLVGLEKDWNYVGSKRSATYTNLDPGEYIFRVKGSNNDGFWNEKGVKLKIIVKPPFWKTWWFYSVSAIIAGGCILSFVHFRTKNIKKQKENLQILVEEKTVDLRNANYELKIKSEDLKKVNEDVMSSLNYANTIQKAILPTPEKIRAILSEFFIIYRPKDVVSGDFFWFSHILANKLSQTKKEVDNSKSGITFFAAVDCTGHGVPGAFMSIIGHTLLNEIINQKFVFEPAEILEKLDIGMRNSINPSEGITTAGMDVCLCRFEKSEGKVKVTYAGARRPLFFIRKGSKEIEKISGDIFSIGSEFKKDNPFEATEVILEEGSVVYLTTDGFSDQNNPENVKLGTTKLKNLMESIGHLPMDEQRVMFENALDEHQDKAAQRDDITLIGIRV